MDRVGRHRETGARSGRPGKTRSDGRPRRPDVGRTPAPAPVVRPLPRPADVAVRLGALAAALAATLAACAPAPDAQTEATAADATEGSGARLAEHKRLARLFYEPFNTGDVAVFDEVLADDWVEHPLAPGQAPGREGYKPLVQGIKGGMPDLRVEVQDVVAEGDRVAVRSVLSGTPQGPFMGVDGDGRSFAIMTMDLHRFEDGRIVETWHVEDWMDAVRQLSPPGEGSPSGGPGGAHGDAGRP